MIGCPQKYCKYCINPVLDDNGKFLHGYCRITNKLILECDPEETENYVVLPVYCNSYVHRERKISY